MLVKFVLGATAVAAVQLQAAPGEAVGSPAATLKSLISSISGGAVAAPASAPPVSAAVQAIQQDLTDAAIMFDQAMNPYETNDEKSIKAALRSAAGPLTAGKSSASTGASFLRTVSGKIGADELASIAAAALATAEKHVASGRAASFCGTCTPNFATCPEGFGSSGAGVCSPSASYSGYCNKSFALGDYTSVELEEAEVSCDFCFPCK